jgi:glycosyltransferase involved in cell wall biosynthesis
MKSYYSKWFSPAKLGVIYNGIEETDNSLSPDIDVIRSINDFHSQGLKVLGSVGILTKRKGIDHVIYLVAADNRLAFVIIGEGKELQNLINLSERLNITNRCLFCGFRNNAVKYVRYFDLFIMPSKSEGFGLALIEAVQQKVPVICSDIEVFKELFNSAEVSYFKLEDLTSLSEALKIAIETGSVKADLAYVRYLNNYTASLMAGEYYKLYKNV